MRFDDFAHAQQLDDSSIGTVGSSFVHDHTFKLRQRLFGTALSQQERRVYGQCINVGAVQTRPLARRIDTGSIVLGEQGDVRGPFCDTCVVRSLYEIRDILTLQPELPTPSGKLSNQEIIQSALF